ncbi:MAG: transcription antitermination factor NusB [Epulopiscium sp. Nele67-Bin001]|nr:MAG: transcription antitermination factor NusB [Epulopiscium sp. Nuni2H_MBin001]OON92719.1 MAG: transcription antitermination factor NusB [Epulopiscium sp. Nele67-Bin001]
MTRREARECVMQMLYSVSCQSKDDAEYIFNEQTQEVTGKVKGFIAKEFNGAIEHADEINEIIARNSKNWDIDRIAKVDHMILQLAIYEIKWEDDIPAKVSINEAVEIAKAYSTDKSPQFINGILGVVCNER